MKTGRELKAEFALHGVTARAVARQAGINYRRLSDIVCDVTTATPTEMAKIRAALLLEGKKKGMRTNGI